MKGEFIVIYGVNSTKHKFVMLLVGQREKINGAISSKPKIKMYELTKYCEVFLCQVNSQ